MSNDLNPVRRLVEFGLSNSVAEQMVDSMNHSLKNMRVPGVQNQMHSNPIKFYYALIDNVQSGPFSEKEIYNLVSDNRINSETFVWRPGLEQWDHARNVEDINRLIAVSPPAITLREA